MADGEGGMRSDNLNWSNPDVLGYPVDEHSAGTLKNDQQQGSPTNSQSFTGQPPPSVHARPSAAGLPSQQHTSGLTSDDGIDLTGFCEEYDEYGQHPSDSEEAMGSLIDDICINTMNKFRLYISDNFDEDTRIPSNSSLATERKFCGYVYDSRCVLHKHPKTQHPERPARTLTIIKVLQITKLAKRMKLIFSQPVDETDLLRVHSTEHVESVEALRQAKERVENERKLSNASAFANADTSTAALLSAGGVLELVKAVCNGDICRGIAIVRPPGHHAEHGCIKGFCFYNNVAIAAAWASERSRKMEAEEAKEETETRRAPVSNPFELPLCWDLPRLREGNQSAVVAPPQRKKKPKVNPVSLYSKVPLPAKVLIVDWDVHHGNGTQHAFEDDPNVLFFSVHRWENGGFYPGGDDGGPEMIGQGMGTGTTINVGWNGSGPFGDAEYYAAWQHVLLPAARNFDPDLVIVSAGFDAAAGDPLGECLVSPVGYGNLLHQLLTLANGRVVVALEGGYSLRALSQSCFVCASVLLGKAPPRLETALPSPSLLGMKAIAATVKAHRDAFLEATEDSVRNTLQWAALTTLDPDMFETEDEDEAVSPNVLSNSTSDIGAVFSNFD